MLYVHHHDRTRLARRREPRVNTQAPPQFARQIDAALRLAPAEAIRGHTAVMLFCDEPAGLHAADELHAAEEALREIWTLDAVHPVRCPVESWTQALDDKQETDSWLRHYVIREIHEREPSVLAILDDSQAEDETRTADALTALLRGWGASHPVAVLQLRDGNEVGLLTTPGAFLEDTG